VLLWLSSQAFADFYPVMQMTVTSILGFDGWVEMGKGEIEQFVASLNRLFESLEANRAELNWAFVINWRSLCDPDPRSLFLPCP
jgi:hypothetical protein